jgi:hypothetical protein
MAYRTLIIMLIFSTTAALAQYGGGTGDPDDPYLIYTAEQMNAIGADANDWDKHFKLMADLDLSDYTGTEFNIIGQKAVNREDQQPFTGVFDGNGHIVLNLTYDSNGIDGIGLFGNVDGRVENLGLVDPNINAGTGSSVGPLAGQLSCSGIAIGCWVTGARITGGDNVGGLVGEIGAVFCAGNTVAYCSSTDCSVSGSKSIGGLVGTNQGGLVSNCYCRAYVQGQSQVGGLAGEAVGSHAKNAEIYRCYCDGTVLGVESVGGLVGRVGLVGVRECYSTADVIGNTYVGGFIGANGGSVFDCFSLGAVAGANEVGGLMGPTSGDAIRCYSSGVVVGMEDTGGLVGLISDPNAEIVDCFWDTETSGQATSAGGQGMTTVQMRDPNTFLAAGWDFVGETENDVNDVWAIREGQDYPKLVWKRVNLVGLDGVDFRDYTYFANYWAATDCNESADCSGADIDFSGSVDAADVKIFCDHWQEGYEKPGGCGAAPMFRTGPGAGTSVMNSFGHALLPLVPAMLALCAWGILRRKKAWRGDWQRDWPPNIEI